MINKTSFDIYSLAVKLFRIIFLSKKIYNDFLTQIHGK